MKLRILGFLIALTIMFPTFSLFAQPYDMSRCSDNATGATITGYVVDLITGDPIKGAKVFATLDKKPKLESNKPPIYKKKYFDFTDAEGLYLIENIPSAKYEIQVKAEDYFEGLMNIEIPSIGTYQVDFDLNPCVNGASGDLHGFVHDAITGDPIASSKVYLKLPFKCISEDTSDSSDNSYEGDSVDKGEIGFDVDSVFIAFTDEYGEYTIKDIPIGEFSISARVKDYEPATESALIKFGVGTELNFNLNPCGYSSGSVSGFVKDEETGKPISYTMIFVHVKDFTSGCVSPVHKVFSGEDGFYTIDKIPAGTHSITGLAKGYIKYSGEVTIETGINTEFDIILSALKSGPTGTLKGIVIDSKSEPVEGASIKLVFKKIMGTKDIQKFSTQTQKDGYFVIEKVPVGEVTVTAKKGNQGSGFAKAEILEDETTEVRIVISKKK
jgi:hypothetical protein